MKGLEAALGAVLADKPARSFDSIAAFRAAWRRRADDWEEPVDQAIVGGALADRLGYAFLAGYAAALRRLVPGLEVGELACLCVTEAEGGHPRSIRTALEPDAHGYVLTGKKRWATLAGEGDTLLVAASLGWEGERNRIRLVAVPANAEGVRMTALPETPFTPEIPHYEVDFEAVRVKAAAVLPKDGYTAYVRPFRTIEDIHVSAAAAAYLLRTADAQAWPRERIARLAALVATLRGLAEAPADAPAVHVALAGALANLQDIAGEADGAWSSEDPEGAARWRRDRPLLRIAESVRVARTKAAWEALDKR